MASTIKVDNVQNQPGTNIINKCSTTITIGASSDTVALASGASQTGFGRTGTVDWDTASIKTAGFSAVSGNGYFCNTTGGIFTLTLPAGSAGDIVGIADYTRTFNTNNLTVTPNGSEKIGGADAGGSATLSVDGQSATFVYVDGTEGWINIQETQTSQAGASALYVTATGGTPCSGAICGNFKSHVFTGPGTLCVSCAGNACGSTTVDYLVAAGGGGGASKNAAGGGAGGFRLSNSVGCMPAPTMSPLSSPTGITVSATGYPVTVGGGGTSPAPPPSGSGNGVTGSNSVFSTITSTGGGGGGGPPAMVAGVAGGSGGGGRGGPTSTSGYPGGAASPTTSPAQGTAGGAGFDGVALSTNSGGGGGAAAAGGNAAHNCGGDGGIGSFVGDAFLGPIAPTYGGPGPVSSSRYFSGGGGGGCSLFSGNGVGGAGGGGEGRGIPQATGTVNTGGGGGGTPGGTSCCASTQGGAGGSGVVTIRYKFQ